MAQALKRLERELRELNEEEPEGITAGPIDDSDFFKWEASVLGPENSPYEGGTFNLNIEFHRDHPFRPPRMFITTKIFHPNLNYGSGQICCCALDFLQNSWSPDFSISRILKAFQQLLQCPNIDKICGLGNEYAGKLYKEDKDKYEIIAKEWTEKYASE